jgi:hypothetical protein
MELQISLPFSQEHSLNIILLGKQFFSWDESDWLLPVVIQLLSFPLQRMRFSSQAFPKLRF